MSASRHRSANTRRTAQRPAFRLTPILDELECRANPATPFTFAGTTFDQDLTPNIETFLSPATYGDAIVTAVPNSATGSVDFPDLPTTGFNTQLTLGTPLNDTGTARALNLPAGNVGTSARSGIELSYTGNQVISNIAGDDIVVYESGSNSTSPEGFMVRVSDAGTGMFTPWYYFPADSFSVYTDGGPDGAFATLFDFSDMGIAPGGFVDRIQLVNLTDEDRTVDASGQGAVLPEDNGTTSSNLPDPGPLANFANYGTSSLDPDPLYVGVLPGNAVITPTDLTATITADPDPVTAGNVLTYTATFTNIGPNAAAGSMVTVDVPDVLSGVAWTAVFSGGATGTMAGTGDINETVDLPVGGSVAYTITGTVPTGTTGPLPATATVTAPMGVTDVNPANNTATVTPTAVTLDVSAAITADPDPVTAGETITYTATFTNEGTADADASTVTVNVPDSLSGVAWTAVFSGGATGTMSGTGDINETVDLPVGGSVVYTITGTVPVGMTGPLPGTATVTNTLDGNPTNDTATVTPVAVPAAPLTVDLSAAITADPDPVTAGGAIAYTATFTNAGMAADIGARVSVDVPDNLAGVTWTAVFSGGATGTMSGTGDVKQAVNLPVGGSVVYTITGTVPVGTAGPLPATATIAPMAGLVETNPADNTATVTPTAIAPPSRFAAGAGGGVSEVVVFDGQTQAELSRFNPFPGFAGGARVAVGDVTGDGIADTIAAAGPGGNQVLVFDGVTGDQIASVQPFEDGFVGGLNVTAGDLTGDGKADIVVSADQGGGARVIVFDGAALSTGAAVTIADFIGLADLAGRTDDAFRGGARVALGDITGDGVLDLIVGAGFLGGPRVTIWDGVTVIAAEGGAPAGNPIANFFAFEASLRNGVYVAAGDITADGVDDVILGAGPGGGPRVRVADGAALFAAMSDLSLDNPARAGLTVANFFAGDSTTRGGIHVAGRDLDADGLSEVITGSGDLVPSEVRVYAGTELAANPTNPATEDVIDPFAGVFADGVFVG